MRSEAQRSFAAFVEALFSLALAMGSGGLEGHALFGMEFHVESVPDGRAQRRMASREQDAAAELPLEVDELPEEHLLIDARLRDVVSFGPRLGELHVLGAHREDDAVAAAQIVVGQDFDLAELRAHAEMPGLGAATEDAAIQKIRRSDEVGDELAARPLVDFARRADLLDMALVHHRDRVRQRERLALVVGRSEERRVGKECRSRWSPYH